jgi:hypothetical protein
MINIKAHIRCDAPGCPNREFVCFTLEPNIIWTQEKMLPEGWGHNNHAKTFCPRHA